MHLQMPSVYILLYEQPPRHEQDSSQASIPIQRAFTSRKYQRAPGVGHGS